MLIPMETLTKDYGVAPLGVLHLGAHLGEEGEAYQAAGAYSVWWVEANSKLIEPLEQHCEPLGMEQVISWAAITERDGAEVVLHVTSNDQSSSLLPLKRHRDRYPSIIVTEMIPMGGITVDSLVGSYDCDFLNMDLQGGELAALRGMPRLLKRLHWIYTEVNYEELYEGCPLLGDIDEFLEARSFQRVAMADTGMGWGDALYSRGEP